jgi:dipeptidyl aminopeptidase/acylaminoacyl peptidase
VYRLYRSQYAYDPKPLNAKVERLGDDSDLWHSEKITIDTAYGERIPIFLFLPRNAAPPFQTVIFFPGGNAYALRSNAHMETRQFQFLLRSGRAVVYPVYRGTFDRWVETHGERDERDIAIQDAKDGWRVLDYLQTRPDIDKTKIGYYGISAGADMGSLILADEPRIKAAVYLGGGLDLGRGLPEVDQFNFAPHVTLPLLMLNGRYDFVDPVETSQKPLFQALGTPPDRKRHVIFESGHAVIAIQPMVKEILDWLDTYLGPVKISP